MEMLVTLILVAFTTMLMFQMLGSYRIANQRVQAQSGLIDRRALFQAWFRDSVNGLFAAKDLEFVGDAARFRGTTLNPLYASEGAPTVIEWRLLRGNSQMEVVYLENGIQRWRHALDRSDDAHFAYVDVEDKLQDGWPPRLGKRTPGELPALIMLVREWPKSGAAIGGCGPGSAGASRARLRLRAAAMTMTRAPRAPRHAQGFILVLVLAMLVVLSLLAGSIAGVTARLRDQAQFRQIRLRDSIDIAATRATILYLLTTQRMTVGGVTVDRNVSFGENGVRAIESRRGPDVGAADRQRDRDGWAHLQGSACGALRTAGRTWPVWRELESHAIAAAAAGPGQGAHQDPAADPDQPAA